MGNNWLVVSNICYLSITYGKNHPNWLLYFSEGWLNHQPVVKCVAPFFRPLNWPLVWRLPLGLGRRQRYRAETWLCFGLSWSDAVLKTGPKKAPSQALTTKIQWRKTIEMLRSSIWSNTQPGFCSGGRDRCPFCSWVPICRLQLRFDCRYPNKFMEATSGYFAKNGSDNF